jgi:hypothetical protein
MLGKALLSASVSASEPPAVCVEDVFSTYLYTGNGSTQTITNGIDLSTNGGLVWIKRRNLGGSHNFIDTVRGQNKILFSDFDFGEFTSTPGTGLTSFTSSGFELGPSYVNFTNTSGSSLVSWTFRKAEKFFDVVTWTGTGADQTISHNLGSTPGCIIVKQTSGDGEWYVYHRSLSAPSQNWLRLGNTAAANGDVGQDLWGPPTSTTFKADTYLGHSTSGATYVAYLFAHDAGGFGDDGEQNVISCGSFTADGSGNFSVNLGYEPQWLMFKRTDSASNWVMIDNMRGWTASGDEQRLLANTSGAETTAANYESLTATGFESLTNSYAAGSTYIYIAIRRGPMRAPTSGTEVFAVDTDGFTLNNGVAFTSGWPVDYALLKEGSNSTDGWYAMSRLQGNGNYLQTNNINAEASGIAYGTFDHNTGWFSTPNASYSWMFRRAPGFFDVVAYTGNGVAGRTVPHNLGVAPEMMIVKSRSDERAWRVYTSFVGNTGSLRLNSDATADSGNTGYWNNTTPTDASFTLGIDNDTNSSGQTYIAYLFATLAGISKVGSYTGTGTTLNVDCGFTAGARFVLIKRTDSTGDWYVWDTARGIVLGDDPYLLLNSTAAEVTNTDYIDPLSSGFQISSTAPAAINASGGTYIFLAIA